MNIRNKEVGGVLWGKANSERNLMPTTEFRLGLNAINEEQCSHKNVIFMSLKLNEHSLLRQP